jgi:cation transport ATPase
MPEVNERPLIDYHPDQAIVRKRQRAGRQASRLHRQSDNSRRGAIIGFAASVMASIVLTLLMVAGLDIAHGYGIAIMLCLPFVCIAVGSLVALIFLSDAAHRAAVFGLGISVATSIGLLLMIVAVYVVKHNDYVTGAVIILCLLFCITVGAFIAERLRR